MILIFRYVPGQEQPSRISTLTEPRLIFLQAYPSADELAATPPAIAGDYVAYVSKGKDTDKGNPPRFELLDTIGKRKLTDGQFTVKQPEPVKSTIET